MGRRRNGQLNPGDLIGHKFGYFDLKTPTLEQLKSPISTIEYDDSKATGLHKNQPLVAIHVARQPRASVVYVLTFEGMEWVAVDNEEESL